MQRLKAQIEAGWSRHLTEHALWKKWAAESPTTMDAVRQCLLAPGKRLRPMLFGLACRAFGRDPVPDLMPAALALELVHNFILVHDDLMDRSETRRGVATLPRRFDAVLAGRPAAGFRGGDLALVTGDLLYTVAMESLMHTKAAAMKKVEALQDLLEAALDTGHGALLEVRASQTPLAELTPAVIESVYALKTGSYSFALPLRLATIFCGMPPPLDTRYGQFGRSAGIAYQLKNDRDVLRAWLQGGPLPDDVRDKRHTWPLTNAWHAADANGRQMIAMAPAEQLKPVFETTCTLAALDGAIDRHAQAALNALEIPALREWLGTLLRP